MTKSHLRPGHYGFHLILALKYVALIVLLSMKLSYPVSQLNMTVEKPNGSSAPQTLLNYREYYPWAYSWLQPVYY